MAPDLARSVTPAIIGFVQVEAMHQKTNLDQGDSKMKKLITLAIVLCATIGLATCSNPSGGGGLEFVGTWTHSQGGQTETLTFTSSTFSISDSGVFVGNGSFSIQAIDEGAKHIQISFTSGTGLYAPVPPGTVYYMTYSISGNSLYADLSTTGYPASATLRPYTRQ
jgi:hypothetical protein